MRVVVTMLCLLSPGTASEQRVEAVLSPLQPPPPPEPSPPEPSPPPPPQPSAPPNDILPLPLRLPFLALETVLLLGLLAICMVCSWPEAFGPVSPPGFVHLEEGEKAGDAGLEPEPLDLLGRERRRGAAAVRKASRHVPAWKVTQAQKDKEIKARVDAIAAAYELAQKEAAPKALRAQEILERAARAEEMRTEQHRREAVKRILAHRAARLERQKDDLLDDLDERGLHVHCAIKGATPVFERLEQPAPLPAALESAPESSSPVFSWLGFSSGGAETAPKTALDSNEPKVPSPPVRSSSPPLGTPSSPIRVKVPRATGTGLAAASPTNKNNRDKKSPYTPSLNGRSPSRGCSSPSSVGGSFSRGAPLDRLERERRARVAAAEAARSPPATPATPAVPGTGEGWWRHGLSSTPPRALNGGGADPERGSPPSSSPLYVPRDQLRACAALALRDEYTCDFDLRRS